MPSVNSAERPPPDNQKQLVKLIGTLGLPVPAPHVLLRSLSAAITLASSLIPPTIKPLLPGLPLTYKGVMSKHEWQAFRAVLDLILNRLTNRLGEAKHHLANGADLAAIGTLHNPDEFHADVVVALRPFRNRRLP